MFHYQSYEKSEEYLLPFVTTQIAEIGRPRITIQVDDDSGIYSSVKSRRTRLQLKIKLIIRHTGCNKQRICI